MAIFDSIIIKLFTVKHEVTTERLAMLACHIMTLSAYSVQSDYIYIFVTFLIKKKKC